MKKFFAFLLVCGLILSCNQATKGVKNIETTELKSLIAKEKLQLLDVRTPAETANGVIKGAITINVFDDNFAAIASQKLDKSKPVYVYCRTGARSIKASNILLENGFQPINVLGGYTSWK